MFGLEIWQLIAIAVFLLMAFLVFHSEVCIAQDAEWLVPVDPLLQRLPLSAESECLSRKRGHSVSQGNGGSSLDFVQRLPGVYVPPLAFLIHLPSN